MPMQNWFRDAKLGIFVHWGVYAVDGVPEPWSFYTGQVSHEQYMKQLDGFTASRYDPGAWADLFVRAGARYAVLTARHHDGVALWDTAHGNLDVVRHTPAGRDLLAGYTDALRERGLKVGFYYSHSDWSHPDYASIRHPEPGEEPANPYSHAAPGAEDPEAWVRYLAYRDGQVGELVDAPRETVSVRGLRNRIRQVTVVGTGAELGHHVTGGLHEVPGVTWLGAPGPDDVDAYATVLALELDGELDLYRGTGRD